MYICNISNNVSSEYVILKIQEKKAKSIDPDEAVHYEPPHQELHCLQVQLFVSVADKVLKCLNYSES